MFGLVSILVNTQYTCMYILLLFYYTGSLPGETVSPIAPRYMTYGGTGDLAAMMDFLVQAYPCVKFIGVGFSMGGNILLRYLGEQPHRQRHFLGAQSWCQGYDAGRCFRSKDSFGYSTQLFYRYLTFKLKSCIRSNYLDKLFGPKTNNLHSSDTSPVPKEIPSRVHTYARVRDRKQGPSDRTRDENGYLLEGWEEIPQFDRREVSRLSVVG